MGHYESGEGQLRSSTVSAPSFEAFKDHCSGKRTNTNLQVVEIVRAIHPDKHVTPVHADKFDLIGFAKAGYATADLVTDSDGYHCIRTYIDPESRMEGGDGILDDKVHFGQYRYSWEGSEFIFYRAKWTEPFVRDTKVSCIVSNKTDLTGHHSKATDRLLTACGKWTSELHDELYVFDAGQWTKNKQLHKAVQSASWDDVILDSAMKEALINDVQSFFAARLLYAEYGVPWKRGLIMHGTPGCGKTISIKALINSMQKKDVASLYVKSFKCCDGPEYSIRAIFDKARTMAPCLLIFEDLDSLVEDKVRSYFLNEVDGLENNDGILMIGSTNHLERLDPGISKRPSRFDRKYHYKLPGHNERVSYSQYWRAKLQKQKDLGFTDEVCEIVARLSEGFSFAYMKELFVQTLLAIVGGRAMDDEEDEVSEGAVADAAKNSKVVEGSARLLGEGETTVSTEKKDEAKETKPERRLPDVEIPEHLKDNALLRILKKQIVALIKDMDNSGEESTKTKEKSLKGDVAAEDCESCC